VATREWRQPAADPTRAHLQITLPEGLRLATETAHPTLALSPDGSKLVFVATDGRVRRLYKRELRAGVAQEIRGTENAASPFFSRDGAWIGYSAGAKIMKVSSSSGAPVAVHTTTPLSVHRGAAWASDDTLVMALSVNSGLTVSSAAGDELLALSDWKPAAGITARFSTEPYSWPSTLPDGRTVVFTDGTDQSLDASRVARMTLGTGAVTALGVSGTNPRYAPTGHLVYGRGGGLYAAPLDPRGGRTTGPEVKVMDGVAGDLNGSVQYAVGGSTLAYVAGASDTGEYEVSWVDRQGKAETLLGSTRPLFDPRLSPDGLQLAAAVLDGSNLDVWLFDLKRRAPVRRLTTDPGEDFGPVWHPTGRQLALGSELAEDADNFGPGVAWLEDLGRSPVALTHTPGIGYWEFPSSWSPDGGWLAYVATRGDPSGDILLLRPKDAEHAVSFLATPADERAPTISPDGRWIAYVSDDTGRFEIYVQSFPQPSERTPISSDGGTEPVWARNGRELFFRNGDQLMAARVDGTGDRFRAGDPTSLFQLPFDERTDYGSGGANYDVSPDGSRFLLPRRKHPTTATVIDVVLNWPQTLLGTSEAGR
jgi:Tol biopolymer transport system component